MQATTILNALKDSGLDKLFDKETQLWKDAFAFYNKETNSSLSADCGACFKTVLQYLIKRARYDRQE